MTGEPIFWIGLLLGLTLGGFFQWRDDQKVIAEKYKEGFQYGELHGRNLQHDLMLPAIQKYSEELENELRGRKAAEQIGVGIR